MIYAIAVDFDGTVVKHEYPEIREEISGAVDVLKELVAAGHYLILHTMRCDEHVIAARRWFEDRGIPLFGINCNPAQSAWTTSPKTYANLYIDDAAAGCPLIYPSDGSRPFVNWIKIRKLLIGSGVLPASVTGLPDLSDIDFDPPEWIAEDIGIWFMEIEGFYHARVVADDADDLSIEDSSQCKGPFNPIYQLFSGDGEYASLTWEGEPCLSLEAAKVVALKGLRNHIAEAIAVIDQELNRQPA